jgi:hypothetical protein
VSYHFIDESSNLGTEREVLQLEFPTALVISIELNAKEYRRRRFEMRLTVPYV